MAEQYTYEPMLDMYLFETTQNIEQLETCILEAEQLNDYTQNAVNEIFRIMHTIKGSSAMMLFNNISTLAHAMEDLFYYIREQKPEKIDCSALSDLILEGIDFIKEELQKIRSNHKPDGDCEIAIEHIKTFLALISNNNPSEKAVTMPLDAEKQHYYIASQKSPNTSEGKVFKAILFFEDDCKMENIRAYTVIHHLKEITQEINFLPEDILDNDYTAEIIREQGFVIYIKTDKSYEKMHEFFMQTMFLKQMELEEIQDHDLFHEVCQNECIKIEEDPIKIPQLESEVHKVLPETETLALSTVQSMISVSVTKLDKLMDLVGEMVIAEAMVTQNPDLKGLELENFQKAARQFRKITSEMQDMVMSIRMVPLSVTFHKMHRIIRDMSKKLDKEVRLSLIGEETEVDKNIIEQISDPLMHLVRNAIDHGIETRDERKAKGKPGIGTITLEAKNAGSEVLVTIKDDGRGLDKIKILQRAQENGLLTKSEAEMTEQEMYNLIFLPGFSTKESVTEFSGRGVGMDVVTKNIEGVGGTVLVESTPEIGSAVMIRIPLTLAIIDGMNIKVGCSRYTLPITAIKQSFRPHEKDIIIDPDGYEFIMVRGTCHPILRLHEYYGVDTDITQFSQGILIMVEQDRKTLCLFADALLGQQQVVVKSLPNYIKNTRKIEGLTGCTLLGDGSISLILDVAGLINKKKNHH